MQDSSRTIVSSLGRFFTGTMLSRLTGLGREVVMAACFGTSPLVASFWMAFRFAHLLRRLFGEGALHVAFVPHFESLRKKDPKEAAHFFFDLSSKLSYLLFFIIVLSEVVLGGFLLHGNLSENNHEVVVLTMIMLPAVIFICLHALNTSLLQCEERYFLPSASPVILNLIWIGTLIAYRKALPWHALEMLSIVIVFAFALQWLVTQIPAARFLHQTLGKKVEREKKGGIFALLRPFLLGMVGVAATQINNALDVLFARASDAEGPAILWYALRLQQLPLALLGVGLSGALLPPISRAIQSNDWAKAKELLHFSLSKIAALMLPITAATFALGYASVNLVYGRGEFNGNSLVATTHALWAYGAGLFPQTVVMIFAAAFFAMKDYKVPTVASCTSVLLNVALNSYFVYGLKLGAISIAYATSTASAFNALILGVLLFKRIGSFGSYLSTAKITIASLIATLCHFLIFHPLTKRDFFSQLSEFSLQALFFGGVFLLFAFLLKCKELFALFQKKTKF